MHGGRHDARVLGINHAQNVGWEISGVSKNLERKFLFILFGVATFRFHVDFKCVFLLMTSADFRQNPSEISSYFCF